VPGADYINNWESKMVREELYIHATDDGTDFNSMDEPDNLAYNASYASNRSTMRLAAVTFFHDFLYVNGVSF
jgi:hypothetical protein